MLCELCVSTKIPTWKNFGSSCWQDQPWLDTQLKHSVLKDWRLSAVCGWHLFWSKGFQIILLEYSYAYVLAGISSCFHTVPSEFMVMESLQNLWQSVSLQLFQKITIFPPIKDCIITDALIVKLSQTETLGSNRSYLLHLSQASKVVLETSKWFKCVIMFNPAMRSWCAGEVDGRILGEGRAGVGRVELHYCTVLNFK